MEIEKQVCSLELAKKLKELGVNQESFFHWTIAYEENKEELAIPHIQWKCESRTHEHVSDGWYLTTWAALTVSELTEILKYGFSYSICEEMHTVSLHIGCDRKGFMSNSFANCLAEALIHLIENNLINLSLRK